MDLGISGNVVLISGSSRGIGKAIAYSFLKEGCITVITGREETPLIETQTQFQSEFGKNNVIALQGDMTSEIKIKNTLNVIIKKWSKLNSLIVNIGSGKGKTGWDLANEDWLSLFEKNFLGGTRLVNAVLPYMIESKSGSIVFISSIAGLESLNAPLPYSAAKAALINYCKNLARLVAPNNIRVNCVAPGNILFPGGSWEKHLAQDHDRVIKYIQDEVPMQRFGKPEEIADVVVFLTSPRSSFVTGDCVVIDGGQTHSW